jgi:hypothetical protein
MSAAVKAMICIVIVCLVEIRRWDVLLWRICLGNTRLLAENATDGCLHVGCTALYTHSPFPRYSSELCPKEDCNGLLRNPLTGAKPASPCLTGRSICWTCGEFCAAPKLSDYLVWDFHLGDPCLPLLRGYTDVAVDTPVS